MEEFSSRGISRLIGVQVDDQPDIDWKMVHSVISVYLTDPSGDNLIGVLSHTDSLSILLESGHLIPSESLNISINSGLIEAVALILEDGRIVPTIDDLLFAVDRNNADIVRLLLQDGRVDPVTDDEIAAPLSVAAYRESLEVLQVLLYDPRIGSDTADMALLVAVDEEATESVRMLVYSGKCTDEGIQSALIVAVQEGYTQEVVDILK